MSPCNNSHIVLPRFSVHTRSCCSDKFYIGMLALTITSLCDPSICTGNENEAGEKHWSSFWSSWSSECRTWFNCSFFILSFCWFQRKLAASNFLSHGTSVMYESLCLFPYVNYFLLVSQTSHQSNSEQLWRPLVVHTAVVECLSAKPSAKASLTATFSSPLLRRIGRHPSEVYQLWWGSIINAHRKISSKQSSRFLQTLLQRLYR